MAASQSHPAVPFSQVLQDELEEIRQTRRRRGISEPIPHDGDSYSQARRGELLGLALSGGGIRSASFNLGVLQGLAEFKLLPHIDYLSTVSGGGYIGAWFISLLSQNRQPDQVEQVQKTLSPCQAHHPEAEDQEPIDFLRQYSNYLTPRLGFYSADVWTMVATWSRNFILNLLLLVSFIGAVLILPRLLGLVPTFNHWTSFRIHCLASLSNYDPIDAVGAFLVLTAAGFMLCQSLRQSSDWWKFRQRGVQWGITFPLFIGTLFLARWLQFDAAFFRGSCFWSSIAWPWGYFAAIFLFIARSSRLWSCFLSEHPHEPRKKIYAVVLFVLAFSVPSFVTALMLWSVAGLVLHSSGPQLPWALLTWGPPGLVLLLSLGVALLIGIFGLDIDAQAREWLGRLRAWTLIYSVSWIIVFAGAIYGPRLVLFLFSAYPKVASGLSLTWIVTTIAGVLSGKSAATNGKPGSATGSNRMLDRIAVVAPFVFMIGFILLLSFGIHAVLTADLFRPNYPQSTATQPFDFFVANAPQNVSIDIKNCQAQPAFPWLAQMEAKYFSLLSCAVNYLGGWWHPETIFITQPVNLLLVLTFVAALLGFRLDLNIFSLHEFYKNRLVRCYLGAVRCRRRKPDPFTGFDAVDDQPLTSFKAQAKYFGPYPIINTTLNVSTGENLARQERKGASFIFTPLYSGFNSEKGNEAMRLGEELVRNSPRNDDLARFAYRPTKSFCYPRGIHLGTAIAVSGAAANPNQGYHTSAAVAFLMTIFDVRLGWYLGNPQHNFAYKRSSPRFNLLALTGELFGLSTSRAAYVNLSDGGQFDNMGLYELIRRQCRYIIVSDAEQDRDFTFSSFTQTIRNCRTDFGVEIKIALDRIKRKENTSSAHCVVGTIEYPCDEKNSNKPNLRGYLLYLKSSLTGDEAADVAGYQTGHSEFPHQSTGNQWFTESQFEAYRKLGEHVVETAFGRLRKLPAQREEFFNELHAAWYPPSERVDRLSAKHAERFTELTADLASEDRLTFLDEQIFAGWHSSNGNTGRWERNAMLRCSALVEFMETLYSDLNLESKLEREHPHNQGWLKIFDHWVQQPIFRETWRNTQSMYAQRFRDFYEDRVNESKTYKHHN